MLLHTTEAVAHHPRHIGRRAILRHMLESIADVEPGAEVVSIDEDHLRIDYRLPASPIVTALTFEPFAVQDAPILA